MRQMILQCAAALAVIVMVGCASHTPAPVYDSSQSDSGQPPQRLDTEPRPTQANREPADSRSPDYQSPEAKSPVSEPALGSRHSAIEALLEKAGAQYRSGNYQQSVATAERALRIDRRDARVYLLLAKNYWQLGVANQTAQFARQGLRYSGNDKALTRELERLLASVEV